MVSALGACVFRHQCDDTLCVGAEYSRLRRHWPDASGPQIVEAPPLKMAGKASATRGGKYSL